MAGLFAGAAGGEPAAGQAGSPAVSDLKAEYRAGQVFLTWREAAGSAASFTVYVSPVAITAENLKTATRAGQHIEPHSARDWWQDPASFDKNAGHADPVGFVIQTGRPPLDPTGGLFVYTVSPADPPALFFAVTGCATRPDEPENVMLVGGANTLTSPVACGHEPIQAIWQGSGEQGITRGAGRGRPLVLDLHARGGGIPSAAHPPNFLLFGDATTGWRAGLPFKFTVSISDKLVRVAPNDRAWTGGRPQTEAKDDRNDCPAVNTWWFGYHEKFYESALAPKKVINNYTERWVLAVLHWAQAYLETDRPATYVCGGSMGGSGAVALCLHYPAEFAAAWAEVPMVRFVAKPVRTLNRLEALCGPIDEHVLTADGARLIDYVDGAFQAKHSSADLPYLFILHGRKDPTIPWALNPAFYTAMGEARQGMSVFWNDQVHNQVGKHLPEDVDAWDKLYLKFRLDAAFPVFTANSDNRNYGAGDPADGDLVGWINRGLDWKDVVDTDRQLAMTILANHPQIVYPVTVAVTFRRVQKFRTQPGQQVQARIGDESRTLTADQTGLVTIPDVKITDKAGVRIVLTR